MGHRGLAEIIESQAQELCMVGLTFKYVGKKTRNRQLLVYCMAQRELMQPQISGLPVIDYNGRQCKLKCAGRVFKLKMNLNINSISF